MKKKSRRSKKHKVSWIEQVTSFKGIIVTCVTIISGHLAKKFILSQDWINWFSDTLSSLTLLFMLLILLKLYLHFKSFKISSNSINPNI